MVQLQIGLQQAQTEHPAPARHVSLAAALLVVAWLGGCGGGGGSDAPANQTPVAAAKLVGEAVLQATTRFDTTGTADADGSIASRSWMYGDGQSGTVDSHIYSATGSYTATLTVTDNQGATASRQVLITVAKCSADGLALAAGSPQNTTVCMQTNLGELVLELFPAQAPATVANFMAYVDNGFYNGTLFHRAEPGFVIQGGGYTTGMVAKPASRAPVVLESRTTPPNARYTLAMARTDQPNSATTEFFINLVDNNFLDNTATLPQPNGHAVFGQVLQTRPLQPDGADAVLAAIASVPTTPSGGLRIVSAANEVVIRSAVRLP